MDVIAKIDYLRKQKEWSIYKLAEESELTQSTVSNIFTRHSIPSIATLKQICGAFNISLSEFFSDSSGYTDDEMLLIRKYRNLDDKNKKYISQFIDIMAKK